MNFIRQLMVAAFSVGFYSMGSIAYAQDQDFTQVEIQTIPVAENVYMLTGEGGNIGVAAGDDGVLLIDDQYAPLTGKIKAAVEQISEQPIKFLLNTHWHFDHTGGNENLGNAGVVIVAHDQVYTRMSTDQFIEAFGRDVPASPPAALPKITFNDTATFHLNGQTILGFHVKSAHTDGDTVIHFPDVDVIHTGDIYFNGLYPFIDTSSGGSIEGMIQGVDKILALAGADTKIIPGHGALSNRAELETYQQMLKAVKAKTESAIAQGLTLEEFIASNPTAEFDQAWGQGFLKPEDFQSIVYQDLAQ
ncbi:MAG: MBL fold metallo-hydrolase [Cyanobacteria bacterium P01_G01_bin.39]